ERTVEPIGPQMGAGHRVNELSAYSRPAACGLHTALQQITHTKLAADLLDVDCLALVGERGVSGDHEQRLAPRQGGDDVFDQAVYKILLLRLAAHRLGAPHR